MKNKSKKTNIKLLLIILLTIILILFVILLVFKAQPTNKDKAMEKLTYINDNNQWEEETLYPDYAAAFGRAYEGDLTIKDIGKSMYYVSKELLPVYYEELKDSSEEEIIKYYKKESESIYINLAIKNQTQFLNLINELQKLSGDSISLESYRIDLDSIKTGSNYTKAILYIKYQGNEEISINIVANNKISSKCSTVEYSVSK